MNEDRPLATIDGVWRLRDAWANAAREGKAGQESARKAALWLGTLGALLSAGAVQSWEFPYASVLPIAATATIAIAGYLGRELITVDRESRWARARILAEALQRECWRGLMQVPPYHQGGCGEILSRRATELMANVGVARPPVPEGGESRVPDVSTIQGYIEKRASAQMEWYESRAGNHRTELQRLKTLSFVIGATAVLLGVVGSTYEIALAFLPVGTTAVAAIVAWLQSSRLASMVDLYQETASRLRLAIALWEDGATARSAMPEPDRRREESELVESCEAIMSRENDSWRADWLSEEGVNKVLAAVESAKDAGDGQPG